MRLNYSSLRHTQYLYSWQDKTLIHLMFLYHYNVITRKSFVDTSRSIIKGITPRYRNTYYCKPLDKWFNNENTDDIFREFSDKFCNDKDSFIPMEDLINLVMLITGHRWNYAVNCIFDVIIKPNMVRYVDHQYDNEDLDRFIKSDYGIISRINHDYSNLKVSYNDYYYYDEEEYYVSYDRHEAARAIKRELHKEAKKYLKGSYDLNPLYVETESLDSSLSMNYHIFDWLIPLGGDYNCSFTDANKR